jgi:hypothetical protein
MPPYYAWKKKYAHLSVSELRRLLQLEEEISLLKRLAADLSLNNHLLSEALRKKAQTRTPQRTGSLITTKPHKGSVRATVTHSQSGPCAASVWVISRLGASASRRLAGEQKTGAAALSTREIAAPCAGMATQVHRTPPCSSPDPQRSH